MVCSITFCDSILTALQKNVKNFKGGNLTYFSKNWYKCAKDKVILDITTNGLKLDLKELTQQLKIAGQKTT